LPCFGLSRYALFFNLSSRYLISALQYHPTAPVQNAVTAIFQTESAAKAALDKAHHRYGLVIESQPTTSFVGPPIPPRDLEATSEEGAADKPKEPQEVKEFQLDIWPSDFVHEKYIKSSSTNPLYGPFSPILPENSFIGGTLKQSVPPSPWARGLMDWETDAVRRKRGSAGLEADLDGDENVAGYMRRQKRRQMNAAPKVMSGLMALKKERGQRVEEERQKRDEEAAALREDVG
jgi:hypothetical protein